MPCSIKLWLHLGSWGSMKCKSCLKQQPRPSLEFPVLLLQLLMHVHLTNRFIFVICLFSYRCTVDVRLLYKIEMKHAKPFLKF